MKHYGNAQIVRTDNVDFSFYWAFPQHRMGFSLWLFGNNVVSYLKGHRYASVYHNDCINPKHVGTGRGCW